MLDDGEFFFETFVNISARVAVSPVNASCCSIAKLGGEFVVIARSYYMRLWQMDRANADIVAWR